MSKSVKTKKDAELMEEDGGSVKKIKILFAAEIVVFAGCALFLIISHLVPGSNSNSGNVAANTVSEGASSSGSSITKEEADAKLADSIALVFPGDYITLDGKAFSFDYDGSTFSGYLDDANPNVEGTYALSVNLDDGNSVVTIESGKNSKQYEFWFDDDGNTVLLDESGEEMVLEMD